MFDVPLVASSGDSAVEVSIEALLDSFTSLAVESFPPSFAVWFWL